MSDSVNEKFLSDEWWKNATAADVSAQIALGADVDAEGEDSRTPLMCAIMCNGRPEVMEALLVADVDINAACSDDGTTALMCAAALNLPAAVEFLVRHGANINARDYLGVTALDYARENDCVEAEAKLIELGAEKSSIFFDDEWWPSATPADVTAHIADGADINATDEDTRFPLMYAAELSNNPEVIKAVIDGGADVNAVCLADGMTALMYAAWNNPNPAICQTLIELGADTEMLDDEGLSASDYATENKNPAVAEVLKK